ncbi:HlyD family efflux transporter periplasmic adaptor subunit [Vibrio parahaemolyticus]|nr:HlyD family efflux transporter periplasmic adaptor subunit [Vibrio parahaemolyticus]EJL8301092.1 HlyD family efflux transporter periplasmic adaptor subunit [Vibrio parahaemolyticus]EJU9845092.1 HlyD family efflux transporter periplasmic adaptor subunit [Vibrio parahaemolyticus]HAS6586990.1 HlyD family efflux transporter periplasmic adaptor subunit [Vibrio parahaemolyticus]HCG7767824.1 HlyD family efflux transporter periplasmic adaptor subunit [Vibrio parahaemolyticus]
MFLWSVFKEVVMSSLFRQQAVDAQKQRLYGSISLAQPASIYGVALVLCMIVVMIAVFLFVSEYTRKETVRGYLVPEKGVLKTYASRAGTIEQLHVSEGELVLKGQPLATLVLRQGTSSGAQLSQVVVEQYKLQLLSLVAELKIQDEIEQKELQRVKQAIKDVDAKLVAYNELMQIAEDKLSLQENKLRQQDRLFNDGYLSLSEYQDKQQQSLTLKQELHNARTSVINLRAERNSLLAQLALLPSEYALKRSNIERQQADLQRVISETETNYRYVIEAPESGVVAAIPVVEGEFIASSRPLLTLLPENAVLVAELLMPTRSSGFMEVGHTAKLRFDAFPYQRFGSITSEVVRIDKSLVVDGEADLPFQLTEPVYRVRTKLSRQQVVAYGEAFPLKAGMLFEADIILDKRSLIEWILDPIYSLKGRLG